MVFFILQNQSLWLWKSRKNSSFNLTIGKRELKAYFIAVRIRTEGNQAVLTIKGLTVEASRPEFEYPIPFEHAIQMLDQLCEKPLIEKSRYKIPHKDHIWEVDEFLGLNRGLIVAEIELQSEDETFEKPGWIGKEVTADPRYFNSNLVTSPFSTW